MEEGRSASRDKLEYPAFPGLSFESAFSQPGSFVGWMDRCRELTLDWVCDEH